MSARAKHNVFFDFVNALFSVISGAISVGVPKQSSWMRIINVESIQFALSTTGTVAGTWLIEIATAANGQDAVPLPAAYIRNSAGAVTALPVPAGSATGPTVFAMFVPDTRYTHMRVTFNPTAGAGNAQADTGLITSRPFDIGKILGGVAAWFVTPASSTHAGQPSVDYCPTYWTHLDAGGSASPPTQPAAPPTQNDGTPDAPIYVPAIDSAQTAVAFAALISGANAYCRRLGALEVNSIRAKYLPTSGAGRIVAYLNAKGMG